MTRARGSLRHNAIPETADPKVAQITCAFFSAFFIFSVLGASYPGGIPESKMLRGDFFDYLVGQQAFVSGKILQIDTVSFSFTRPRTHVRSMTVAGRAILIKVDSVYQGSIPDSEATFYTGVRWDYPSGLLVPGQQVFAWGSDPGGDGRLLGELLFILPDGSLKAKTTVTSRTLWRPDTLPALRRADSFLHAFHAKQSFDLHRLFVGARGVALLRIRTITVTTPGDLFIDCDSLAVLSGTVPRTPRVIHSRAYSSCLLAQSVGDTLLVPSLPGPQVTDTLLSPGCLEGFAVRRGRSLGFNTALITLDAALRITPTGVSVNAYQTHAAGPR